MNTRTRGKNVPKDKDTTLDARRSKTASTPDRSEPKRVASDIEDLGTFNLNNTLKGFNVASVVDL